MQYRFKILEIFKSVLLLIKCSTQSIQQRKVTIITLHYFDLEEGFIVILWPENEYRFYKKVFLIYS